MERTLLCDLKPLSICEVSRILKHPWRFVFAQEPPQPKTPIAFERAEHQIPNQIILGPVAEGRDGPVHHAASGKTSVPERIASSFDAEIIVVIRHRQICESSSQRIS